MRLLQELKKIGHLVDAANRVPIRAWLAACVFHADRVSPLIGHCGFSGQRRYGMVQSAPSSTFPLFYSSSRNSASVRSAFTVTDVRGEGSRHLHAGELPGENVKIETIVNATVAESLLQHLSRVYFDNYAVITYVLDVAVIRGGKYV